MSRDRLAAARAQRQQTGAVQAHEMSNMGPQPIQNGHEAGAIPAFLTEITEIQDGIERIKINVSRISALYSRTLIGTGDRLNQDAAELDGLKEETRALSNNLKERIKSLESAPTGQDAQMRRNRISLVRSKFIEAIQNYQQVEQDQRARARTRVERQVKIVKPDATPEEVATVTAGGGTQIFAQALTSSPRYGESRQAYREVQDRQQDLKKMEQTLAELAQLFADMGTLVDQQEETINEVETTAMHVEADTEKAVKHTGKAVGHARSYRKGRWICFFVFLFVIVVLAIVLGVVFGRR